MQQLLGDGVPAAPVVQVIGGNRAGCGETHHAVSKPAPSYSQDSFTRSVLRSTNSSTIPTTLPWTGIGSCAATAWPARRSSHSP